ncbi:MAG: 4-hydroxy-tetrahydrodipicolinate reductase [Deltaproteobacteria bacterium]|jgi:4-hydroxy-tetrahydrodipicolinate reductase|nr:4-hydroxy-tetrahydrodipicolinate reductase [Deltaproteobacteria bacterium]MBW2530850.1 4-hydroxy-tetrahydrodipicolinate reductase [Deltaproteobacteria bacterium]
MKLTVCGAAGRMGRAVVRFARERGVTIVGAAESPSSEALGRDVGERAGLEALGVEISADLGSALLGADVVIDFTTPAVLPKLLAEAQHAGVAVVSGTTGLETEAQALLDRAAERIAVLWAPNMSIGVQVLTRLCMEAAKALGDEYAVEIVETHHGAKADAPSGTARQLVRAVQAARPELEPRHGREGLVGPRPARELGVHAIRGGSVVGDHTVHLLGPRDRLEITHRAVDRDLFALGALRAADFVATQPPGRYDLSDVISRAQ